MRRVVQPELLDRLPPENPEAIRSRADLRRVNSWMGHRRILTRALAALPTTNIRRVVELGAGDGTLALSVAAKLSRRWANVEMTLVDQQALVTTGTLDGFRRIGWKPSMVRSDVFKFLIHAEPADIVFANLFLHHFEKVELQRLLPEAAASCSYFVALEPRRHAIAEFGCKLLGLIGCNRLTRHDARVSVRAGFCGQEISSLWPDAHDWSLHERAAGMFSHLFIATRKSE